MKPVFNRILYGGDYNPNQWPREVWSDDMPSAAGLTPVIDEATELEVVCRAGDNSRFYFIMNFKDDESPIPSCFAGKTDLLTGEVIKAGEILEKYAVRVVEM